jgi:epoxyqueuosine reductase
MTENRGGAAAPTPEERIRTLSRALGFSKVGIAKAGSLREEGLRLKAWLDRGFDAGMRWMGARYEERIDPGKLLPGARSVVSVALNYYTAERHSDRPERGKISRYAWGDDYHRIMAERLECLWELMRKEFPGIEGKWYVDTGPVMEKVWAARSGIGWIGKHANLITEEYGSWVFLGEIITTMDLEPDRPSLDRCGTCVLCLEACPTRAIVEPYVVDSARCLSYLTIEHRGEVSREVRDHFQGWIFGCDVCQDVCPWNRKFQVVSEDPRFAPRAENLAPVLEDWAGMDAETFGQLFQGSPVRRTKHEGLMRNVRLARLSGR